MNILIVEADAEFREHLSQRLRKKAFTVFDTGETNKALAMVADNKVEAIVLGLSGFKRPALSLMEALAESFSPIRIIIINRIGDVALSIAAMKLGAFGEVTTPVDIDMLERMLRAPE